MLGSAIPNVGQVVPAVATGAAVATVVGVPLFRSVKNAIRKAWYNYGSDELKEIEAVQKAYRSHCLRLEARSSLTTLEVSNQEDNKDELNRLPIFFQMDEKIPVLFKRNFVPQKKAEDWLPHLNKPTPLNHYIEEMINYLCLYQGERDQRWGRGNYNYDPTNLFFEEFKHWLIELSKAHLDQEIIEIVDGRRKYLSQLYEKNAFIPGKDLPTRQQIILYIKDILEKGIIPLIHLELSRRSAREHFRELKVQVEIIIKNSTKFLFYVFRNEEGTPESFVLEQIRHPTIPSYGNAVATRAGSLLQHLIRTSAFTLTFPPIFTTASLEPINNHQRLVEYSIKQVTNNSFLGSNQKAIFPLILRTPLLTSNNWYLEDRQESSVGILEVFRKKEYMDEFLMCHAYLQKLCLFYIICDQLYELSGDGGNLMVYGFAFEKVYLSLKSYESLLKELEHILFSLSNHAETHKRDIVEKKHEITFADQVWQRLRSSANNAYDDAKVAIKKSRESTGLIQSHMQIIRSPDYRISVEEKLNFLSGLVTHFSEGTYISENRDSKEKELSFNTNRFFLSPRIETPSSHKGKEKEKEKEDLRTEEEPRWEDFDGPPALYQQGKYREALEQFIDLLEEGSQDSRILIYSADCCVALGNKEIAINFLTQLLDKEPKNQDALYRRGCIHYMRNELLLAKQDIDQLLIINENHKEAIAKKVAIKMQLGESQKQTLTK